MDISISGTELFDATFFFNYFHFRYKRCRNVRNQQVITWGYYMLYVGCEVHTFEKYTFIIQHLKINTFWLCQTIVFAPSINELKSDVAKTLTHFDGNESEGSAIRENYSTIRRSLRSNGPNFKKNSVELATNWIVVQFYGTLICYFI